jgi:beta-phosphoglucomutase
VFDSILFDFDGVLADTEPVHFACWREILAGFEIDLPWPYYQRECIGVADWVMLERLGASKLPPIPVEELWPSYARKQELFRDRIKAQPPFQPQTLELLKKLHSDYKLAVVSSSHRSEIEPPLERAGIRPLFQALVCGHEVPNLKPAPDPYLRAAEVLASRTPLVIEDSDAGVAAGEAAGFTVLRISAPEELAAELSAFLYRKL